MRSWSLESATSHRRVVSDADRESRAREMATIGLFDVDRTGFPNLALMKLSAWHKAQGDTVLPLNSFRQADRRYASCVFSWNKPKAETLASMGAVIGGVGIAKEPKLPPDVHAMTPDWSLYGIDYGLGFLVRGCIRDCAFCGVPENEGLPWLDQPLDALINPARERPFVVLLDNEFFWNIKWAIATMETLTERGIDWCPSQGLDIRCTTPSLCETLAASPFWNLHHTRRQITFAFDSVGIERRYRQGVEMLFAAGIKAWQLQSYVLVGFDSTIEQDLHRIGIILEYGIDPFVMLYRNKTSGKSQADSQRRNLARWVNRRLCRTVPFEDYDPSVKMPRRSTLSGPLWLIEADAYIAKVVASGPRS
jgi:hypothetical protein